MYSEALDNAGITNTMHISKDLRDRLTKMTISTIFAQYAQVDKQRPPHSFNNTCY
jgi:hypothetical protein